MNIFNNRNDNALQRRHTKELEALTPNTDVKLDGSEWARLANQRLHRERHPHEPTHKDVLTSAEVTKNILHHESRQTAVEHWFCPISSTYEAVDAASDRATELLQNKRLGEVLEIVDGSWSASIEGKVTDGDKGTFWTDDSSEYFECRPSGESRVIKRARVSGSFSIATDHKIPAKG